MRYSVWAFVLVATAPVFGGDGAPGLAGGVQVHEWGTFTSVAGETGAPQPWAALAGPSDLPCFVYHLAGRCIKCAPSGTPTLPTAVPTSTVRMETPVLYFYSSQRATLSVRVDFPQGWITEWYPNASLVSPQITPGTPLPALGHGRIEWNQVAVSPDSTAVFPKGNGASRYYMARKTDARPISVSGQTEKLIFYRGIANFPVPLWAKISGDGKLDLRNSGDDTLPIIVLFENRGGKIGYRTAREFSGAMEIEAPPLTADLGGLKDELASALEDMGLYEKEARAMLATWGDSWFEEGMRVFYLMPRRSLDAVLPVAIRPAPAAVERAFVGRVEILSPFVRQDLERALSSGDTTTLAKYGRFLQPFAERIPGGPAAHPASAAFFQARYDEAAREFATPSCIR